LDTLQEPVLIYDEMQVIYANDAACRVLGGVEPGRLEGVRVQDFILPDLADISDARRAYVIEQGVELSNLLVKVRDLDGEPIVLRVDIRPLTFENRTAAMATLARP
jgi:PAS domain S-box-containing protein